MRFFYAWIEIIVIVIVIAQISVVGAAEGTLPPSLFVISYLMQQLLSLGSMGPNIHGWVVEVVEFMLESDGTRDAVTKSGRRCFLKQE